MITMLIGVMCGVIFTIVLGVIVMPKLMIVRHKSSFSDIDKTVEALLDAIDKEGWKSPGVRNMTEMINKNGVEFHDEIRLVELCKAKYAEDVLTTNPEVSTLMPCAWGVYKAKDGQVYISGMNMGLMGKIFGGNISRVMSGFVAKEEARILAAVVQR